MLAVNKLINDAYVSINMTGVGESTEGDYAVIGVQELNRAITELNNEGFIAMSQKWVDAPARRVITFRKFLEGEANDGASIDMAPPQKVVAVARKIGTRFLPLDSGNHVQMAMYNPSSTATSWTYDTDVEMISEDDGRDIGVLTLDGEPRNIVRVWYNSKLPKYELDGKIFLSDLYDELLMSALCVRLANFYDLSDSKKADCNTDLLKAKSLIKCNNATQRMLQCCQLVGDYNASYNNLMNGYGF